MTYGDWQNKWLHFTRQKIRRHLLGRSSSPVNPGSECKRIKRVRQGIKRLQMLQSLNNNIKALVLDNKVTTQNPTLTSNKNITTITDHNTVIPRLTSDPANEFLG